MTQISRDIIVDLLPLYIAGEVSPATRHAVDEYLGTDPELTDYVRHARSDESADDPASARPAQDLEMRTMRKTRKALALQRWLFALAIAFTSVGLSTGFRIDNGRITDLRLVAMDHPALLLPCLAGAVICWIFYARSR